MLRLEASLKLAKDYYESHSYLPKHIGVCRCNGLFKEERNIHSQLHFIDIRHFLPEFVAKV